MFIGGCAGSTTCGIEMFRLQVLANARIQLAKLLRPHAVVIPYFNKKPIPEIIRCCDGVFLSLYFVLRCYRRPLGLTGLDIETALSGAATAIGNVGPGLGEEIGTAGNFDGLSNQRMGHVCRHDYWPAWLFTVLVMLMPGFWRR